METKHTKANGGNSWSVAHHYDGKETIVVHAHPKRIALCYDSSNYLLYPFLDEVKANAKLIAAAPELLEALLIIINDDPTFLEIPKVEQAIKKATE